MGIVPRGRAEPEMEVCLCSKKQIDSRKAWCALLEACNPREFDPRLSAPREGFWKAFATWGFWKGSDELLRRCSSLLWSPDFSGLYDARYSWNSASLRNSRSRAAVTT
jgi:hypothetical protein